MRYWSAIQSDIATCYLCGRWIEYTGQWHHVFNKFAKKNSEKHGFMVRLCAECHGTGRNGIHGNAEISNKVRMECRNIYNGSDKDFIKKFNKNIVED